MQRGAKAAFEGCQVQKSQDTGNFVRIAGMIAIITLISTVVAASFIYHNRNNLVSPRRNGASVKLRELAICQCLGRT
jgi:hypothetical protein